MILTSTQKAFAKINLSLDIVSKMDDGYHYLRTVMQSISLCDEITISCASIDNGKFSDTAGKKQTGINNYINIKTTLPYVPDDGRNIAVKAANSFFTHTGITGYTVDIKINKKIPVCAGLGGGSADAACVLRMLDEMFETSLGRETLEKLGLSVGADVPFCITGGTKLAEGRGEILTGLPDLPKCYVVLCKPEFSCSTPELFKRVVIKKIRIRPDTQGLIKAVKACDLGSISRHMYNVFEDLLPRGRDDIESIKSILLECGALGAVMTGSGPTVFGLFDNKISSENAYSELKNEYVNCYLAQI